MLFRALYAEVGSLGRQSSGLRYCLVGCWLALARKVCMYVCTVRKEGDIDSIHLAPEEEDMYASTEYGELGRYDREASG